MSEHPTWNPLTEWKDADITWEKVKISPEDLRRFTKRSNIRGLLQTIGFLAVFGCTGGLAYYGFLQQRWILMVVALYLHGTFYKHFGDALHEFSHGTVFASRWLNMAATGLYGWLYWPWNPTLYRVSHQNYHHRYTLHQKSDGEDTPNYVGPITRKQVVQLFLRVFEIKALFHNLGRLFTLKPTSKGWRGRGYQLDNWETFILQEASEKDRKKVARFAIFSLISHVAFATAAILSGHWFLVVLITLAPFYGAGFHGFYCSTHQHAGCDANHPDFRVSCGDAILDPFSSFMYWHMEYHIEHHMFAGIPCYNLPRFSRFVADQLPPKEYSIPRILKLTKHCPKKYGTYQEWRDNYGLYKGF